MNITEQNIVISAYLFLIVGGLIVLSGAILVYLNKKNKKRK
ncbi:LPXTG cell wall anchor domain-containing protein [Candidatus Gottesmanbacteria bacterium]|nr:LPXTG cell wall anchor domain-containing protein [Candidatus Gottesmanbacteria bacterium]